MAILTCGSSVSNAFGSLVASGILAVMDGKLGFAAWRWLFFVEGCLTVLVAITAFYIIPDFPSTPASWLTPEEQLLAKVRMEEDLSGLAQDKLKQANDSGLRDALTDWTVWWLGISMSSMTRRSFVRKLFPNLERYYGLQSVGQSTVVRTSVALGDGYVFPRHQIDRNNVAAARLRGFEEDLHLEGQQFNTILSTLYVGYILMQVPSNIFLNRIGKPSIYLPGCMAIWGGMATTYTGVLVTRFFIGFVEAAFFPGALFILSKWYKRRELGERTAILTCGIMLSNAFGSLLASAVLDIMDGVLGYAAWRWLFYVEGTLTVVVALSATCVLPDFPSTPSRWLTPEEQALAQIRMEEDGGGDEESEHSQSSTSGLILALSDCKVWWLCIAQMSLVVSLSFNPFFPTLSATMGYNPTVTLLLCSPPWALTAFLAFKTSRHSDANGERFFHIAVPSFFGIVGFLIAMSTMNTAARYFSMFLIAQSYTGFVVFWAWASNSLSRPPSKRAVRLP
ncbi:major facilitator superfamily domain-containing protein [Melanogaster broomeanus]|nr:major facilitator superfamily domain-containing protein [Melanogaster broomeanus]